MRGRRSRTGSGRGGGSAGLDCSEVRPLLSALVDQEGDDIQRALVERHVRRCAGCRDFESFALRSGRLLRDQARPWEGSMPAVAPSVAHLAHEVRSSGGYGRRGFWRSGVGGAAVGAALSLGVLIGGLGVWTLTQEDPDRTVQVGDPPGLPRIVAARTLDPGEIAGETTSVLTAWAPSRGVENTFDEKAMYWTTPMSHFEQTHYLPEEI